MHIYPDPADSSSKKCMEGSHFAAYKVRQQGIATHFDTDEQRFHDMVFVDNQLGVNLQTGKDREECYIKLYDSIFYGENELTLPKDCPGGNDCYCTEKTGMQLFGHNFKTKEIHITGASALPMYKVKSESGWGLRVELENLTFKDFKSGTNECGQIQSVFRNSFYASDYIPLHTFKSTRFVNVADDAVAYFDEPPQKWAVTDDCGEWPCTAPENIVMKFQGTSYEGISPALTTSDMTITYALGDTPFYSDCQVKDKWNAWQCTDRDIGVLYFDSLDGDTYDRSVQPIFITDEEGSYTNKLNSMMDHVWDGFYTGQTRLSRFPAQIETGKDYTLRMTGTPPGNMRYTVHAEMGGIKLKIPYPNAGSY